LRLSERLSKQAAALQKLVGELTTRQTIREVGRGFALRIDAFNVGR